MCQDGSGTGLEVEPTDAQVYQFEVGGVIPENESSASSVSHLLTVEDMEGLGDTWRDSEPGDYDLLQFLCRQLLVVIGEDPDRPGLVDTPRRWASYWREFIEYNPGKTAVTFDSVEVDQMVVVSGMKVWSLCEHHLLPFWCDLTVGYIAGEQVLGLSKIARVAQKHAHRLQLQERLVHDIAAEIQQLADTEDVAVMGHGQHLCMVMRGIKTPGIMSTSVLYGSFRDNPKARSEFLHLTQHQRGAE